MRATAFVALVSVLMGCGVCQAQSGGVAGPGQGVAPAQDAAPPATEKTERDLVHEFASWQTSRLMDNFKSRNPKATPEDIEHVRAYLLAALAHVDGADLNVPTLTEVDALLEPLDELTSDAVVKVVRTLIWYEKGLTDYIVKYPLKAEKLAEAQIPPDLAATVCAAVAWCQEAAKDSKGALASRRGMNQAIASLMQGEWTADEQRRLVRQLRWITDREIVPLEAVESLTVMTEDAPAKNTWLREVVLGDMRYQAAWRSRGHGFARTVTEAGNQGFVEQLAPAREHYLKAHELRPDTPEAAAMMVLLEMCRPSQEHNQADCRGWFDRAIKAQFDCPRAWAAYLKSQQQRWQGSDEAVLAVGDEAAATKRYDTLVPLYYLSALDEVALNAPPGKGTEIKAEHFGKAREVLMGCARAAKGPRERRAHLSRLVYEGWASRKYEEVLPALEALGEAGMDVTGWPSAMSAERISSEVRAFASKAGFPLIGAQELAVKGEWDQVSRAVKLAMDGLKDEPEAVRRAVKHLALPLRVRADLESGRVVGPAFEEGLPGWQSRGGAKVLDASSIEITDGWITGAMGGYGRKYVIELELDASASKGEETPEATVAIVGVAKRELSLVNLVLRRAAEGDELLIHTRKSRVARPLAELKGEAGKPVKLRVEVWGSYAIVTVNGELLYRGRAGEDGDRGFDGDRLGLYSKGVAVYRGIAIKKLEKRPEGVDEMYDPKEGP